MFCIISTYRLYITVGFIMFSHIYIVYFDHIHHITLFGPFPLFRSHRSSYSI